jgi:hypothetical protein
VSTHLQLIYIIIIIIIIIIFSAQFCTILTTTLHFEAVNLLRNVVNNLQAHMMSYSGRVVVNLTIYEDTILQLQKVCTRHITPTLQIPQTERAILLRTEQLQTARIDTVNGGGVIFY